MASEATRLLRAARAAAQGHPGAASSDTFVNGSLEHRLPGNLNICFAYVEGEAMMMALKDVAVSSGSACTSASLEPSYVLRALGVGEELAHTSIRFGLGRFTTEEEVDYVVELVVDKVKQAARDVAAVRDGQGGHRPQEHRSGRRTESQRAEREHVMAYSEKVIDHYENPRNVGSFDKDDPSVGTGLVGAPACGDVMKLQIKVNDDGVIEDAKFKTFGCGSAIASSSLATEWVKGKTIDQAMAIKNTQIVEELNLPPVKIHCSVLAEDAIKAAIADYKAKRQKAAASNETSPRRAPQRGAPSEPRSSETRSEEAKMAIAVTDRAVAEIKKAAGARATLPKGLRVGIRGGGCTGFSYLFEWSDEEPRARGQGAVVRGRHRCACSSIRRATSISTARRWSTDLDDGPRVQVHEPEREGDVRLRRERQF